MDGPCRAPFGTGSYPEKELVFVSDWPEMAYLVKLTSADFQSVNTGHAPRHGIGNDLACLVCQCLS